VKIEQNNPQVSNLPVKLSRPAQRALEAAGISRLEQFSEIREAEVNRLHGIGPKALELLRRALAANGLSFRNENNSNRE
jgi:hypothetical protein